MEKYGKTYHIHAKAQFNCYIAYDNNAQPNVYFEKEQFDKAVSYYNNTENFNYFCLTGNIHDENQQQVFDIQGIDTAMFNQLLEFAKSNEYNPFTSYNNEDGLKEAPITDTENCVAEEIRFYKESKDGAFSTSKSYTFILHEGELCFLYRYDHSDAKVPVMQIKSLPTEKSDYFGSLAASLQGK